MVLVGSFCKDGLVFFFIIFEGVDEFQWLQFLLFIVQCLLEFGIFWWVNYVKGVIQYYLVVFFFGFSVVVVSLVFLGGGLFSLVFLEVVMYIFFQQFCLDLGIIVVCVQVCQQVEYSFVGMFCGIMDQFILFMGQKGYVLFIDCRFLEISLVLFLDFKLVVFIINFNVCYFLVFSEYFVWWC